MNSKLWLKMLISGDFNMTDETKDKKFIGSGEDVSLELDWGPDVGNEIVEETEQEDDQTKPV